MKLGSHCSEKVAGGLRDGKARKAAQICEVAKSSLVQRGAGSCLPSQRFSITDLPLTLVIFISGDGCGVHFLVSSISKAFVSTASLGIQDWDSVFMLVCEVLRALNQVGALGCSKLIKTN